jgi:nucleoside-diphosphate-sugar epimerase
MGSTERFLVSGVTTAIGAWVAKQLISEGVEVVALGDTIDDHRLRLICAPTELLALGKIDADIDDVESVTDAMGATTHVIHFDATTEEDCDADPRRAAHESLLRAVTVFESAHRAGVQRLAFQSGMSVFSQQSGAVTAASPQCPSSLRGAMHVATEQMADHYRRNRSLDLVAVRPNLVYGPGVDRGGAASTTRAIAAAIVRRPYRVQHGGLVDFQFVADVAGAFIAVARAGSGRTEVNLVGHRESVAGFLTTLGTLTGADDLTTGEHSIDMPIADPDSPTVAWATTTGLEDGIRDTLETFRWAPRDLYWSEG